MTFCFSPFLLLLQKAEMIAAAEADLQAERNELQREKDFAMEVARFNAQSTAIKEEKRRKEREMEAHIVSQAVQDESQAQTEKRRRQQQQREEMQAYRAYLQQVRLEEKQRERELDKLLELENEKVPIYHSVCSFLFAVLC